MNLNILAVSYKNIWPFKDKILTIFFEKWKFLIKAPVGSGKSFLFFDGLIWGLYKYSTRNMLNVARKDWFIKLLFEINEQKYLVVRNLKKWKSKDGCDSTLFEINGEIPEDKLKIVGSENFSNEDIQELLKKNLNEIKFKNETDLQQNLQSFLPPREVFLNTVFLMQDSSNIFELQAAERLTVLKNVFNLLGIDESKEVIADKKREIGYKIKAAVDTSKYDEKLKKLIINYGDKFSQINKIENDAINLSEYESFFDEIKMIEEKINILDFSTNNFPVNLNEKLDKRIEKNKSEYQNIKQAKDLIETNKKGNDIKIKNYEIQLKNIKDEIVILEKKISEINPAKIDEFKKQKNVLIVQQEKLVSNLPKKEFLKFLENNKLFDDINITNEEITISNWYFMVQELINRWKMFSEEMKNMELKIKNEELNIKNWKEKIENEIKNWWEKIDEVKLQLKNIIDKIAQRNKSIENQAKFDCKKIGTNCPFIKIINKKSFDQMEKQKNDLMQEENLLEKKLKKLENELKIKKTDLVVEDKKDNKNIIELKKNIEMVENKINVLKEFLNKIDYKNIADIYKQNNEITSKMSDIDKSISTFETEITKVEEYKLQIEKNKINIANLDKQIEENMDQIKIFDKQIKEFSNKISEIDLEQILNIEKLNTGMKESYRDIDSLVNDYKKLQIEVKKLQEDEKILNDLYNIFSKELLLIVLQDHLPVLNDIINNYLAQAVDYQINFDLNKTSSDKLELEVKIFDDKWERDVKSLSGGQRIILKLVRMLAISSYMNSPMLFLDETINNLDVDTVAKVADMLKDFVQQRSMKLYAVTHSQQIQEMNIRDKTIEIRS